MTHRMSSNRLSQPTSPARPGRLAPGLPERARAAACADAEGGRGDAAVAQSASSEPVPVKGGRLAPDVLIVDGRPRARRFVLLALAAAALLAGCAAAFNAFVDPYGTAGTGVLPPIVWTDRTLKADFIRRLPAAPELLVLGSSRAMKVEPAYVKSRTGLTTFNAAVSSGKPIDAWAFVNLAHDSWPSARPGYLWLLDVEAFRALPPDPGLLNTPALARYLSDGERRRARLAGLPLLFSWQTAQAAWRSVRNAAGRTREIAGDAAFAPDGLRTLDYHDRRRAAGVSLRRELAASLRRGRATYADSYKALAPTAQRDFERTLALMLRVGRKPVLVITPMQPVLLDELGPLGYDARRRDVLAYLRSLQKRLPFRLFDFSDPTSFNGSARDFYDGYHMTVQNTRRLIDALLAKAPDALR